MKYLVLKRNDHLPYQNEANRFPNTYFSIFLKIKKKFPNDYTLQFTDNMPKSIMKKNTVIYEIKLMSKD